MSDDSNPGLLLRESIRRPPDDSPESEEGEPGEEEPLDGIRCPLCSWRPRPSDRWACRCGMGWNTFLTRGRCPRCEYQWRDTACLACHRWSRHLDWYEARARRH